MTNPTFAYDSNGNLTSEDGVTTVWSSFNMATSITRGSASDTFIYNSEHSRAKEVAVSSSGTVTTYYVSPSFEVVSNTATGTTEYHNYISSSTRRVAMLIDSTASTTSWRYFHQDQVGSIDVVTDQTGAIVERLSYDAFGRRRNTNGTDSATFMTAKDSYGYTDQEELDNIGLINMNGRIYDPTIARFMSADPTISRPFDLQSHNRYSYVSNRPFVSIDPTGFYDEVTAADTGGSGAGGGGGPPPPAPNGYYAVALSGGSYAIYATPDSGVPDGGITSGAIAGTLGQGLSGNWTTTYVAPPADPSTGNNLTGAAPAPVTAGDTNASAGAQTTTSSGAPTTGADPNSTATTTVTTINGVGVQIVNAGGNPTIIVQSLGNLPPSILQTLADNGVTWVATPNSATDFAGFNAGGAAPRGYPDGSSYSNVAAAYDQNLNDVVVATSNANPSGYLDNLSGMVLHETGHALDPAVGPGMLSSSPGFMQAYQADLAAGNLTSYESTATNPKGGPSEAFANGFSAYYQSDGAYTGSHPNIYGYFSSNFPQSTIATCTGQYC